MVFSKEVLVKMIQSCSLRDVMVITTNYKK